MADNPQNYSNTGVTPHSNPPGSKILIRWIFGGLTVWGVAQAIGAYSLNHDPRRPLIVLGCMAAFLGFWLVLLSIWKKRQKNSSYADE
jgi:hypothetical protein